MSRKKRTNKQPRDPHRPKSPQNLYFIFMNERRPIIKKKNPKEPMVQITKLISNEWNNMNDNDKLKYKKKAEKLKQEYNKKIKQYEQTDRFKSHQQKISEWKDRQKNKSSSENRNHSSSNDNKQLIECEKRQTFPIWSCGQCTFRNINRLLRCEVCDYSFYAKDNTSEINNSAQKREIIDLTKDNKNDNIKENKVIDDENTNNAINTSTNNKEEKSNDNVDSKIDEPFSKNKFQSEMESLNALSNIKAKKAENDLENVVNNPESAAMVDKEDVPPYLYGTSSSTTPGNEMNSQNNNETLLRSDKFIPLAKNCMENINLIEVTSPIANYMLSMLLTVRQSGGLDLTHIENVPIYSKTIQQRLRHFNKIETNIRQNRYKNIGDIFKDIQIAWKRMYESSANQTEQNIVHDLQGDYMTFAADIEAQFYDLWDEFEQLLIKQGYLKQQASDISDTENKLSNKDEMVEQNEKIEQNEIIDSNNDNKESKTDDTPEEDVKNWLTNTVGLSEYCDKFISNGFDDLSFIIGIIKTNDLIAIGINNDEHIRKILQCAQSHDWKKRTREPKLKPERSPPVILHSKNFKYYSENQKNEFEKFKQQFSNVATFRNEWQDDVTHLITSTTIEKDERILTTKTIKYFQSVVAGSWVLCFDWVEECLNKNMFVDENKYEVIGDKKSKKGCKITKEIRMKNKRDDERLFSNILCVIGDFKKETLGKQLAVILGIGGAKILQKLPDVWLKDIDKFKQKMIGKTMVFVHDKEPIEMHKKQLEFVEKFNVLRIGYQQVFDAISNYKCLTDFVGGKMDKDVDEEPPRKRRKI